jgi:hypothetical protein
VPTTYALIRQAIIDKHQVVATYNGYVREMCPHVIGAAPDGKAQCLFYQFAGGSETGLGADGSPDNWRCLPVANLRNVLVRPGTWHTAPNHSRPQTCVRRIDVQVVF